MEDSSEIVKSKRANFDLVHNLWARFMGRKIISDFCFVLLTRMS